jgi:hypothetical protein
MVADFRHYTGKHNMLKMWVDEFIRQQQQQLSPPQLSPSQLSPASLATTVNIKVLEDEITPDPEHSKASIPPLAAQEKSSPVILANISQAPPTAMVHTSSSNAVSQLVAEMARNSSQKKIGGNESETLTFSEMERRAILRQKESAALSARKMTAAPRNVVLPERQLLLSLTPIVPAGAASGGQFVNVLKNGSSDGGQNQPVTITPLSMSTAPPTVKAASSSGQLLNGGDMLTSGGHLLSSSRLFNSGQLVSPGPRALVSSLVDSAGRPTISGALQTVTVSTPSGQISLTKVIRSVSPR